MLILASVSIATLTGENGIITQAQKSKTETEKVGEDEQIELEFTKYEMLKTKYNFAEYLMNKKSELKWLNKAEYNANSRVTTITTTSGRTISVSESGIIEEGNGESLLNWSTIPTEGTWYVSDECLLFDEEGYVYDINTNFDWYNELGFQKYKTLAYASIINNVGTTKIVFSSNIKK